MVKQVAQQGRSERRREAYFVQYVEGPSDARTKLATCFTILAGEGQTKRCIYDGEDILLEYDGANVLQARYTHGPGIDEPIAVTKAGSTFFYHQDGLGTVTDLTDSTGATAKSYSYDAYGNLVDQTGTVEQPYTYTGREFDSESGLYFLRMRTYDPLSGKFNQKDPYGFNGGQLNLYQYNYNEPLDFTDPFGGIPKSLSKPVDPFKNPFWIAKACVERISNTVYTDAISQGWVRNDKRIHCVVSCEAGKKCGSLTSLGAGLGREFKQLFLQGKIFNWRQGLVDSKRDEDANIYGITCPLNQDCYQRCVAKY